jgi:hypothetical protein
MRSETSSVYSTACAGAGSSRSATSQTIDTAIDTGQLYHGGCNREGTVEALRRVLNPKLRAAPVRHHRRPDTDFVAGP